MTKIRDILTRDLSRPIEEVIKVQQTDEERVYEELSEYVPTERIRNQYKDILKAMADAPTEPHEGVGVWISGFFGSGKSSFAKSMGYVLADREVLGTKAADIFKDRLNDEEISRYVNYLNASVPTEVIMFDVQVDRAVRQATESIAEILYRVLLRELGYAQDFDVAELEIELEGEGRLDEFTALCNEMFNQEWSKVRKGATKLSRASAILNRMDPQTYPNQESWVQSLSKRSTEITVADFVNRTFDLTARRCPGKGLIFIVDEIGQYVARSEEKIENLRAVVEQLGQESRNRLSAGQAVAPVWMVVTSQEKLDEVVAAIDSKRVELARLQDRFKTRIDLAPADIREVATRRVLGKTEEGKEPLRRMYRKHQGQINSACRFERTSQHTDIDEDQFVQFYPYLPHFVDMSIDIMSGIRRQPGAPRHLGGSNRTIIKQAYEMLVHERTALAEADVGTLVTLEKIYELVEGNLPTEKQKDIYDISCRFDPDGQSTAMETRVAKCVCLLEFVRNIPRTTGNIAACLVEKVGESPRQAEVTDALQNLEQAQYVRNTEEGWKLQTREEKQWESERRALDPRPADRNAIRKEILGTIFSEPTIRTHNFKNLQTFKVSLNVDGTSLLSDGQIPLAVRTASSADDLQNKLQEVQGESRNENFAYWVFALTPEIVSLVGNIYASRTMVNKYDQRRAQNQITNLEASCLEDEKRQLERQWNSLRRHMTEALQNGYGLFQGVVREASEFGESFTSIFKGFFDYVIPYLYQNLETGACPLSGNEPEDILKATNLNALPQVLYEGKNGLGLITKDDGKYVVNPTAPVAKEVYDHLSSEHSYGNKVTGKDLENRFTGLGYGWNLAVIRLVLAALLRAGKIELTYQGQKYHSYTDVHSRQPLTKIPAFRSTSFAPRETIDMKTVTEAVKRLEQITGKEVDVEEEAVSRELEQFASQEKNKLIPLQTKVQAHQVPDQDNYLREYSQTLDEILNANTEDRIKKIAGEGRTLDEYQQKLQKIQNALSDENLTVLKNASFTLHQLWPVLKSADRTGEELQNAVEELTQDVDLETLNDRISQLKSAAERISSEYQKLYSERHRERAESYTQAIEEINGRREITSISEDMRKSILSELERRACDELQFSEDNATCQNCGAGAAQMASDIAAVEGLKQKAVERLLELTTEDEEQQVEWVHLSDYFPNRIESVDDLEDALNQLKDELTKRLEEGQYIAIK